MRRTVIIIAALFAAAVQLQAQEHELWYDKPASHWLEALPVGNSHLGAMVYGGTDVEEIKRFPRNLQSSRNHLLKSEPH